MEFRILLVLIMISGNLYAQEFIPLWETAPLEIRNEEQTPGLFLYPASEDNNTGAAVVVCPGGGYSMLAIDHEGHDVAKWLNSIGISAFVLTYRTGKWEDGGYRHPAPLLDGQRAMRWVRHHAGEYGIADEKVGILGFSAGGHLASTVGTHTSTPEEFIKDSIDELSARPSFMILLYPVISFTAEHTHKGSRRFLLGEEPDGELVKNLSNELMVTESTPPAFLAHTSEDKAVPVQNSIDFYERLQKYGIPSSLYVATKGRHGLGLGGDTEGFSKWPMLCEMWLREIDILP